MQAVLAALATLCLLAAALHPSSLPQPVAHRFPNNHRAASLHQRELIDAARSRDEVEDGLKVRSRGDVAPVLAQRCRNSSNDGNDETSCLPLDDALQQAGAARPATKSFS